MWKTRLRSINRQICKTKTSESIMSQNKCSASLFSIQQLSKNIKKKHQHKLRNGGVTVLWNKWNTCPSVTQVTMLEYPCKAWSLVETTFCSGILLKSYPVILRVSTNHRLTLWYVICNQSNSKIKRLL